MIAFSPKQEEAMNAIASEQYAFILFGGAMGGGKTIWGLSALLIMCEVFPGSRWCVIRENTEKLRTTTVPSFKKLNPSGKLRESPYEYTHPNGSIIMFKGENFNNDKELLWLRGLEVSGFLFEEINECQELTLSIAFGRAGRWESTPRPKPVILGTCNPSQGWVKKSVYKPWKEGTLRKSWLYIPSKITDNPNLTQEYVENLLNMPRYQYMVLVEGDWDVQLKIGGEFYKCFELDKHVRDLTYNNEHPLHLSFDFNTKPYMTLTIYQIYGKAIRMVDEICLEDPRSTTIETCKEFVRKYRGHNAGVFVYGDPAGKSEDTKMERGQNNFTLIQEQLKEYRPHMRVLSKAPSVMKRGEFINAVLEHNFGGLSVALSSQCFISINDFIGTKEASDGTKHKKKVTNALTGVSYEEHGHATDSFDYMICAAFPTEYAEFQRGPTAKQATIHGGREQDQRHGY